MEESRKDRERAAAIVLSGGSGRRFGSDVPKQYLEIGGKSVLCHALEAFEKSDVDEIVIVAAQEYADHCRRLAQEHGCRKVCGVITGGRERYDSVLCGLRFFMTERKEADIPQIVLIHDGARPFITPEVIRRIIRCTRESGACMAATPCTDTIKIVDDRGCIVSTTDRRRTWAAQTPQAFYTRWIWEAYEKIIGRHSFEQTAITDDAMVYQMAYPDRPVRVIDAGSGNFKITAREDLARAESVLAGR